MHAIVRVFKETMARAGVVEDLPIRQVKRGMRRSSHGDKTEHVVAKTERNRGKKWKTGM